MLFFTDLLKANMPDPIRGPCTEAMYERRMAIRRALADDVRNGIFVNYLVDELMRLEEGRWTFEVIVTRGGPTITHRIEQSTVKHSRDKLLDHFRNTAQEIDYVSS